jgi:hypothetical protein
MFFEVPDDWERFHHIDEETGKKIARVSTACWYTNLDHGRSHHPLSLMTMSDNLRFSKNLKGKAAYDRYDNFDAIEVSTYKEIPADYGGVMGVPITFLDKYNPEQFEIVGITTSTFGGACKRYPRQIQVGKNGKRNEVTKLNDAPAIKIDAPPTGKVHYIVDGEFFVLCYHRILIRHRHIRPRRAHSSENDA